MRTNLIKVAVPILCVSYGAVPFSSYGGLRKSRGPSNPDHSLEKLANDLNAVLEQISPNGPVILIGHSIGGMTQQTFCRLFGEKLGKSVKGLVLVHTTYTNPLATNMAACFMGTNKNWGNNSAYKRRAKIYSPLRRGRIKRIINAPLVIKSNRKNNPDWSGGRFYKRRNSRGPPSKL